MTDQKTITTEIEQLRQMLEGQDGAPAAVDKRRRFAVLALAAIVLQAIAMMAIAGQELAEQLQKKPEMVRLTALIAAAADPVISDDMVAVVRGGKAVQWEPFIFAELAKKGAWDERPFIALIGNHRFAFFVTEGQPGDSDVYDARYTPTISRAMLAAYPIERSLAGYTLHFPEGKLPPLAATLPNPLAKRPPLPAVIERPSGARTRAVAWNKA